MDAVPMHPWLPFFFAISRDQFGLDIHDDTRTATEPLIKTGWGRRAGRLV